MKDFWLENVRNSQSYSCITPISVSSVRPFCRRHHPWLTRELCAVSPLSSSTVFTWLQWRYPSLVLLFPELFFSGSLSSKPFSVGMPQNCSQCALPRPILPVLIHLQDLPNVLLAWISLSPDLLLIQNLLLLIQ